MSNTAKINHTIAPVSLRGDAMTNRGLYEKFQVRRTDGASEPGCKHEGCEYFVLDLTHDDYALPALMAYRKACRHKFPQLADDLDEKIRVMKALRGSFFSGGGTR